MAPQVNSRRSSIQAPAVPRRGRARYGSDPTPAQAPLQPAVHARPDPDHAWCGPPLKATARSAQLAGPPTGAHVVTGHCHATACPCHGACSMCLLIAPVSRVHAAHAHWRTVPGAPNASAQTPACRRQPPPPAWRPVLPTGNCGKSDYKKSLDNYELRCSRPAQPGSAPQMIRIRAASSRCQQASQLRATPARGRDRDRGRTAGHVFPVGRIDPGNVRWNRYDLASSVNYAPLRSTWPPGPTPLPYFR